MSATTQVPRVAPAVLATGGDRTSGAGRAAVSAAPARPLVRLLSFAALAGYALDRWATLMRPAPGWRLVGLLAIAVVLAGLVPLVARRSRIAAGVLSVVLLLLAFPASGLRWHWLTHMRIADSAQRIGTGLSRLPNVLVPYLGSSADVRLVIVLGAAVLVLDAAAVLAFAPASFGDARRAAAALPLVALAIVPCTLVHPGFPYLQGLLLFVLLAAFVWGERVRSPAVVPAVLITLAAAVAAALIAPGAAHHRPWLNYRSWGGTVARQRVDRFDWNQTYGPLRWPRAGHVVLTVRSTHADYWKAEDLDEFNGYGWGDDSRLIAPSLPAPSAASRARWTEHLRVTINGMQTSDVVGAGVASSPTGLSVGVGTGSDAGEWVTDGVLGPGMSYQLNAYSPRPTPRQLGHAGRRYPTAAVANYLALGIPLGARGPAEVIFPLFGTHAQPAISSLATAPSAQGVAERVSDSPYGGAYALARRLASHARTPYAFVESVMRYLSHGFTYDQNVPARRYSLESFLFTDRRGYCQQFSGAMALLLRMGGLPARVAAGFTTGTRDGDAWTVTDTDAHSWVEVWFPRLGWVRFDPTPASAPELAGSNPAGGFRQLPSVSPGLNSQALARRAVGAPAGATSTPSRHRAAAGAGVTLWPIIAIAAVLLLAGLLARVMLRPLQGVDALTAELDRALRRAGRPLTGGTTLTALERRLQRSPAAAAYVRSLRDARYAGAAAAPSSAGRRALRRELGRGLGFTGRLRALWALPPRIGAGRLRRA